MKNTQHGNIKFIDFRFLDEPDAPQYKARMSLAFDCDPSWDILVSRLPNGTLDAEITTPAGHEYFPDSMGITKEYIKDVRREAVCQYTFERNKAHCR